jgi:hypothetical protein
MLDIVHGGGAHNHLHMRWIFVGVSLLCIVACSRRPDGVSCLETIELPKMSRLIELPSADKPKAYDVTVEIVTTELLRVLSVQPDGSRLSQLAKETAFQSTASSLCEGRTVVLRYVFFSGKASSRYPEYRIKRPNQIEMSFPGDWSPLEGGK